jgi:site-specific recombinase XerD
VVEIRITYNYKQKYISTGIWLYPNQWKNGKIVNCDDIVHISQTLDKLLSNIRKVILDMINEGNIDISTISDRLSKIESPIVTFIDFCRQRATIRKFGKEKDTQERYERFIKLFNEWGFIVNYEDITEKNIIQYDNYLSSKGMKAYSRWNNYHRFLNSFIMDAIEEGYIKRNPYKWINIEKGKHTNGIGKYLTPDEFRKIKGSKMPTLSLEKVRDVFVFQTYTCLSYTDLKDFDARNIQEVKGMKVYTGNRNKTNKPFTIPILSPAWDILMKYDGKLPIISNVKYNEYLKVVAQSAKIDKPISSHWARHTGATRLLNEGVNIQIVSKICGHSSIKITEQIYAKLLDETVVEALSKVEI